MIKMDSKGPVFYRQERVTRYGKKFRIHKFRTMVNNADKIGSSVTVGGDLRITRVGSRIRDYKRNYRYGSKERYVECDYNEIMSWFDGH